MNKLKDQVGMNKKAKNISLTRMMRAMIEVGFIVFLFYSNLLMGEFTRANNTPGKTLWIALNDIFSPTNFFIALISGLVGHFVFEFLRKKL